MDRTETASKLKIKLPEAAIEEIERIITSGKDVKVTRGTKNSIKVFEENLKIKYSQS